MNKTAIIGAALVLGLRAVAADAQPALESEQDRTLYALGVALGSNVTQFALTGDEVAIVAAGIRDAALGNEFQVDMAVYGPQIQALANSRAAAAASVEKEASAAFLERMATEPGAERTASGLVFIPDTVGTGPSPTARDTVRVHYHGTLRDGTVFDSSVERGQPLSFGLDGVIPCWTEALQKMAVGGKARLACPSDIAYGDGGNGRIPGGAALVFDVELLAIE